MRARSGAVSCLIAVPTTPADRPTTASEPLGSNSYSFASRQQPEHAMLTHTASHKVLIPRRRTQWKVHIVDHREGKTSNIQDSCEGSSASWSLAGCVHHAFVGTTQVGRIVRMLGNHASTTDLFLPIGAPMYGNKTRGVCTSNPPSPVFIESSGLPVQAQPQLPARRQDASVQAMRSSRNGRDGGDPGCRWTKHSLSSTLERLDVLAERWPPMEINKIAQTHPDKIQRSMILFFTLRPLCVCPEHRSQITPKPRETFHPLDANKRRRGRTRM